MNIKKIFAVLIFFHYSVVGRAQLSSIDSLVNEQMQEQHITGLSLGIVKNGQVILSKGFGFSNLKDSTLATDKTIYRLASLSKEMIAVNVMILVEQGKLNLYDHLSKYIKDVPRDWAGITIRQLLNHTSGLERESPAFSWKKKQADSIVIHAAYQDPLLFPPGKGWSYSNLGYFILAEIIHKVSNESFEDYMDQFFIKYGLTNTSTTSRNKGLNATKGYQYVETTGKNTDAIDIITFRASSAVASCISDLIRWDAMIGKSNLLSKAGWQKMWEDLVKEKERTNGTNSFYGYGWEVTRFKGHRLLNHSGSNPGFENEYWKFIDDGTSIIILTNQDKCSLGRIAKGIYLLLNQQ